VRVHELPALGRPAPVGEGVARLEGGAVGPVEPLAAAAVEVLFVCSELAGAVFFLGVGRFHEPFRSARGGKEIKVSE
jgi:hypothetical protein